MRLNDCNENTVYRINKFDNSIDIGLYNKLISMGLGEGTVIITSNLSTNSLISFYVDNVRISIRSKDAKYIEVGEYNE